MYKNGNEKLLYICAMDMTYYSRSLKIGGKNMNNNNQNLDANNCRDYSNSSKNSSQNSSKDSSKNSSKNSSKDSSKNSSKQDKNY